MERASVRVRNPFALREALKVALEVAWPDLPPDRVACLRSFIRAIPGVIASADLPLGGPERAALLACVAYFRPTCTCHWFREDLVQALVDLERDLRPE